MIEAEDEMGSFEDKQQLIVSFEEELKKVSKDFSSKSMSQDRADVFSNLGLGKPTTNYDLLIYDGIII